MRKRSVKIRATEGGIKMEKYASWIVFIEKLDNYMIKMFYA